MASQVSFRTLNEVLDEPLCRDDQLLLYILDTDDPETGALMQKVGDVPRGYGETYWISDGTIVGKLASCTNSMKRTIRDLTKRVLQLKPD